MKKLAGLLLFVASTGAAQGIQYSPPAPLRIVSGVPTLTQTGDDTAPLGAELVTNGTFDFDASGWTATNWTWGSGKVDHDTGNVSALSQNITVTNGATYLITFTIADRSAGELTGVTVGAVTVAAARLGSFGLINTTIERTFVAAGVTGAQALSFTPDTNFNGSIDSISVKQVTAGADSGLTLLDSSGDAILEIRGSYINGGVLGTLGIGDDALQFNLGAGNTAVGYTALAATTAGVANTAVGYRALAANTNGEYNVAVGGDALLSNTIGYQNTCQGENSLHANTEGFGNTAFGYASQFQTTTGDWNTSAGIRSLYSITTSGYNTAFGAYAIQSATSGYNVAVGEQAGYKSGATPAVANALTTGANNTFVGAEAGLGSTTQRSNATAIGYQAYVDADNTVVLGDENVTSVLASSDGGATVTAAAFKVGANTGVSGTVVVKGSDGANCNLVFEGGILTSETCP